MPQNSTCAANASVGTTVIIGAGPAGLTTAYELTRRGNPVVVLEQDPTHVGGIARTASYKGFRFDIGGHRFFSKNSEIEQLWSEVLGERMLVRDRLSRIYYRQRFFNYPLDTWDVLSKLGVFESGACVASYLRARLAPIREVHSFEDWVSNAFGRRLFKTFFETYTEKVWGIRCNEISADWASQRIKDLSMKALIKRALPLPRRSAGPVIKTLIEKFRYPEQGPGQMWETMSAIIGDRSGSVQMGESVAAVNRKGRSVASVTTSTKAGPRTYEGSHFVSTMPIRELIEAITPAVPERVLVAARNLRYRDFITVALILEKADLFPDQWIYIHEPGLKVGRIQNFKNWSPLMVPDPRYSVLGLEYFCFDGDSLWSTPDSQLVSTGAHELQQLGLASESDVIDGTVVRQRAAYPVYDGAYRTAVDTIKDFLVDELPNLQLAGRNGMHKYNNQDHAMMTGLMAARNILGASYDLWRVNGDALYLEEVGEGDDTTGRLVPGSINPPAGA